MKDLDQQYENIRHLLEQRENVPTNDDIISNNSSSARYRRRTEKFEFIYDGLETILYGAWVHFKSNASLELIEQLLISFKRGEFLKKLCGKFKETDEVSIKREVALKYHIFLSSIKYNFLCKVQQNAYVSKNESYHKNMMSYVDHKL